MSDNKMHSSIALKERKEKVYKDLLPDNRNREKVNAHFDFINASRSVLYLNLEQSAINLDEYFLRRDYNIDILRRSLKF